MRKLIPRKSDSTEHTYFPSSPTNVQCSPTDSSNWDAAGVSQDYVFVVPSAVMHTPSYAEDICMLYKLLLVMI